MFTLANLIKTILIALVMGISYGFYEASTAFQLQAAMASEGEIGRVDAFVEASRMMEPRYFWPHLIKQWVHYCIIIFVACGLLLAVAKPPNKVKNANASKAGTNAAD